MSLLDSYRGNKEFLLQRVETLNSLRSANGLKTIVEFGYSPTLCSLLNYENIVVIESSTATGVQSSPYKHIVGDYAANLHRAIHDNACYTYFLADSTGAEVSQWRKRHEAERLAGLEKVVKLLVSFKLSNSFLCVWHRKINSQSFEIIKV